MRPWVKVVLVVASLVAVIVLGLIVEDYRAEVRLQAYQARLRASGEKLTVADFVPRLPAANSNGAAEFLAAPPFTRAEVSPRFCLTIGAGIARVAWQQKELPDSGKPNIWPEVFGYIGGNQPTLAAIRAALAKPELVFPNDYTKAAEMEMPHLEAMMNAPGVFTVAAVAEMRAGNEAVALGHLLDGVTLVSRWREPVNASQQIRASNVNLMAAATWELLQSEAWTEQQLAELQRSWESFDLLTDWLAAAGMHRAWLPAHFRRHRTELSVWGIAGCASCSAGAHMMSLDEQLRHHAERLKDASIMVAWASIWRLGFSHRDELASFEMHQASIERLRKILVADSFAARGSDPNQGWRGGRWFNMRIVSLRHAPEDDYSIKKIAKTECARRLTATAIALHRYRARHGEFPPSLDALVPALFVKLPRDFMDGHPLRYRRLADGRFSLWSVGEDLKDDGCEARMAGRNIGFLRGQDLVWPQAASQDEVDAFHAKLAIERAAREAEAAAWKTSPEIIYISP